MSHSQPIAGHRFLVTGGTGFVGSHVVDRLLEAGASEVVILDKVIAESNIADAQASGRVTVHEGDLTDAELVHRVAEGMDGVFHLAVLPLGPCIENPRLCVEVNVVGTFNVIEAAQAKGIKKVVFSSASSVYGDTLDTMDETHPMNARTMYGVSKIAGEHFFRVFHATEGLDFVALRYMNVYGPRQQGGLIPAVIRRVLSGQPPVLMGDGTQSFDFVHVRDVAGINLHAMESEVTDDSFNVGSGGEATVREIAETLIRLCESDMEPEYNTEANVVMTRRVGSNERAKRLLGWETTIGLEDGLLDTITWERQK